MNLTGKVADEKALSDEIAMPDEDDEAAITLVRIKSFSVASEASKEDSTSKPRPAATSSYSSSSGEQRSEDTTPLVERNRDSSVPSGEGGKRSDNDRVRKTEGNRPSRVSLQEEPFNKSRVPRKSVLKHQSRPAKVSSTYDTTTTAASPSSLSPPSSPSAASSGSPASSEGAKSPLQNDRKCCVVM